MSHFKWEIDKDSFEIVKWFLSIFTAHSQYTLYFVWRLTTWTFWNVYSGYIACDATLFKELTRMSPSASSSVLSIRSSGCANTRNIRWIILYKSRWMIWTALKWLWVIFEMNVPCFECRLVEKEKKWTKEKRWKISGC